MSKRSTPLIICLLLLLAVGMNPASGHPKFATREAVLCGRCHVDNQGAALRNEYGAGYYSREVIPAGLWEDFGDMEFTARLHKYVRWGTDIRLQYYQYSEEGIQRDAFFPMQSDFYLGITPHEQWTLYAEGNLSQIPSLRPEARPAPAGALWLQYTLPDETAYIRAGQYLPPYGLRLDDHTSFIRGGNDGTGVVNSAVANISPRVQGMHWKPDRTSRGLSVSLNQLGIRFTGHAGLPTSSDEITYSLDAKRAFWAGPLNVMIGGSYLNGTYMTARRYHFGGLYTGINYGPVTFLGELDIHANYVAEDVVGYTTYSELDIQLFQGIEAVLEYEFFESDIEFSQNSLSRITLGLDLFPIPYIEILPQYRILSTTAEPVFTRKEFIIQGHLWF